MTWPAFFQAFRKGIADRVGGVIQRRSAAAATSGQNVQQRTASSRAVVVERTKPGGIPPVENWDFMIIDVSALIVSLTLPCFALLQSWAQFF